MLQLLFLQALLGFSLVSSDTIDCRSNLNVCPAGCTLSPLIATAGQDQICYVIVNDHSNCPKMQDLSSITIDNPMLACQANTPSKQCRYNDLIKKGEWRLRNQTLDPKIQQLSCQSYYQPSTCEGDVGQPLFDYVCGRVNMQCKYTTGTSAACSTYNPLTDGCQSNSYWLNKQACVNTQLSCNHCKIIQGKWTQTNTLPSNGNCFNFIESNQAESDNCQDGRNKFSCTRSKIPCAWQRTCVTFNKQSHYCDDGLSQSACSQVPFACGWSNNTCAWFDNSILDCSYAVNQVACLFSMGGCTQICIYQIGKWEVNVDQTLNGNNNAGSCVLDTFLQGDDPIWKFGQSNNFDFNQVKQYFENNLADGINAIIQSYSLAANDTVSLLSNKSSNSSVSLSPKNQTNSTYGFLIITTLWIFIVGIF